MTRPLLLLLLLLPAGSFAQGYGHAQRRDAPQREEQPPPRLVAHEWGVWVVERNRVTGLEELAAESPPFVVRAEDAPDDAPRPPVIRPSNVTVRKPVLFLRSDRPIANLQVEVRFVGGRPWLLYPTGQVNGNRVRWQGSLGARGTAPPVEEGHWWSELRGVGADLFSSRHGGRERFLFYDGPVRFRSAWRVRRRGERVVTRRLRGESPVWLVREDGWERRHEGEVTTGAEYDVLRARLREEMERRGLTTAEANSLLDTWRDELVRGDHLRALWFVDRSEYDRMLPLRITPAPAELVRVGLVISRL